MLNCFRFEVLGLKFGVTSSIIILKPQKSILLVVYATLLIKVIIYYSKQKTELGTLISRRYV